MIARGQILLWAVLFIAAGLSGPLPAAHAAQTKRAGKDSVKALTLQAFIQAVLLNGRHSRIAGPIAELIGVPRDAPTRLVRIPEDQATDGIYHVAHVMTELPSDTPSTEPAGLALHSSYDWPGNSESYWFRVSIGGELERAVTIHGKRDEQGKSIKGSGTTAEKDIDSPEIKRRFRHEMDLWLKRAYLKKEWRSAEFSQGELKMKEGPKAGPTDQKVPAQ